MVDEDGEIRRGLAMARDRRAELVPFVGAGLSMPLGLPSWTALASSLAPAGASTADRDPAEVLQGAAQVLGPGPFARAVQHELRRTGTGTTRALQALARSGARRVLTTNLDHAIERAYELAGTPLRPERVGRGPDREELALFDAPPGPPILLKLHGSLERPSTWVLTGEQYDAAYIDGGHLRDFLSSQAPQPLFLGFSFTDRDVGEALRWGQVRWWAGGFAVLRVPDGPTDGLRDRLRRLGLVPLWIHDHSQVPEVIDEIFDCAPVPGDGIPGDGIRDGGIGDGGIGDHDGTDGRAPGPGGSPDPLVDVAEVAGIIRNAVDVRPNQSIVDGRPRRRTGDRFAYHSRLARLARLGRGSDAGHQAARATLVAALRGLAPHRDVLLDEVLPWSLKNEHDHYVFLSACFTAVADDPIATALLDDRLVARLFDPTVPFQARRALARLTGQRDRHPAQQLPPPTVRVGDWLVPMFPLTRHQVRRLRPTRADGDSLLRPYTLRGPGRHGAEAEVADLLARLGEVSGRRWRLPTVEEWTAIAHQDGRAAWPWGDDPPAFQRHAHLTFADRRGHAADHPVEVGVFPEGRHEAGPLDLIGNVYELVTTVDGFALAGGAWSTVVGRPERFLAIKPWGRGADNLGLRPISEL